MKGFIYLIFGVLITVAAISLSDNPALSPLKQKLSGSKTETAKTVQAPAVVLQQSGNLAPFQSLAPIIKNIIPAVVNISTKTKVDVPQVMNPFMNDPFFRQFFGNNPQLQQPKSREVNSVGSGVIIDAAKGYILTNHHVVKDTDQVFVTLNDKRRIAAKLIGSDAETDLAILKIDADNLTAIKLGSSTDLQVGDFVIAVGNPFGLGQTVTHGIVSAKGRNGLGIEGYEDFIQTDAPINPGNSGGALINLNGELIGINTAIVSRGGGSVGIGFAIPVDMAKNIMEALVSGTAIERGQLGLNIQDLTPDIAAALKVQSNAGAVIAGVVKGSEGEKAGLKEGDIVTKFNGIIVGSAAELKNRVGLSRIGDVVKLTVLRDSKEVELSAIIGKKTKENNKEAAESSIAKLKGAKMATLGPDSELYGKVKGLIIKAIEPGSAAENHGLQVGDIITSVNKLPVTTIAELDANAKKNPKMLLLNIIRGNMSMFIVIQ